MMSTDYVTCELHGFALEHSYGPCGGGMDRHHIISRQLMRGCKDARKFVDKFEPDEVFFAPICNYHNAQTKIADLPEARAFMLQKRVDLFGMEYMQEVWTDFLSKFKAEHPDLRLSVLLER
jgi:hypothetical protein